MLSDSLIGALALPTCISQYPTMVCLRIRRKQKTKPHIRARCKVSRNKRDNHSRVYICINKRFIYELVQTFMNIMALQKRSASTAAIDEYVKEWSAFLWSRVVDGNTAECFLAHELSVCASVPESFVIRAIQSRATVRVASVFNAAVTEKARCALVKNQRHSR